MNPKKLSAEDQLRLFLPMDVCHDYDLEEGCVRGTFGLIFFAKCKFQNSTPSSIALKTLIPEKLDQITENLDDLKREFERWLLLPSHFNIIGSRGFKTVQLTLPELSAEVEGTRVTIPVMQMEKMDGSLRDWVESDRYSIADRLCAIAQAFNGLNHLYKSGIEGHGDLKPENILYEDLLPKLAITEDASKSLSSWMIKVADFGLADAWIEKNYYKGAWRQYIAPERLEYAKFIPEKSDIFSMGIIAAEVLQEKHPASKSSYKSESKWVRNAENKNWNLDNIHSDRLRDLILRCLEISPEARPTALEAMHIICEVLKEDHALDIEPTLLLWNDSDAINSVPFVSTLSDEISKLRSTIGLGEDVESRSKKRLYQILDEIQITDYYELSDWIDALEVLLSILDRDKSAGSKKEVARLESLAKAHFIETLGSLDYDAFKKRKVSIHEKDFRQPFEVFGHLVGRLGAIAHIDFEQVYKGDWDISEIAIAGFALHMASSSRFGPKTKRSTIEYLDIAIDLSLTEAAPYFFRAMRKRETHISSELGIDVEVIGSRDEIIADLRTACKLAPNWSEPVRLLDQVTSM